MGLKHNNIKVINPGCNYPLKISEESKNICRKIYKEFFS